MRPIAAAIVALVSAGAAQAQTDVVPAAPSARDRTAPSAPAGMVTAGGFITSVPPDLMRVSKVIGIPVVGSDPVRIGTIDDLVFDRGGKGVAVVIGTGGFLGMGEKRVGVPFTAVLWSTADGNRSTSTAGVTMAGTQPQTIAPDQAAGRMPGANVASQALDAQNTNQSGKVDAGSGSSAPAQPAQAPATAFVVGSGGAADRAVVQLTRGDLQMAPAYRFAGEEAAVKN
jgi:hypothetical protein